MINIPKCLFLVFILIFFSSSSIFAQSAYDITTEMFDRTKSISTLKYKMRKWERIDGEMIEQFSFIKLNRKPLKIYVKQLYPKEGVEVLYAQNENDNMALVNPNSFPWFNLSLDPLGSLIRKNQHHTLFQSGFDHVVNVLEFLFNKYDTEIKSMITLRGTTVWDNKECYIIHFTNPNFKYITYQVEEGETVDSIARKFMLSQHMILELNKDIDDVHDISEGQQIIIPNDYSTEMELLIDKAEMVPLVMKIYDNQGLYEHYAYSEVNIDPVIQPEEFTPDYSGYGF